MSALALVHGAMRHGAPYLTSLVRRYGPVHREMLGPDPIVFACDADLVSTILRNEDQAWSCALGYRKVFADIMRGVETLDMLDTLDFEVHREARRLLQPAFGPAALESAVDGIAEAYDAEIDTWLRWGRVSFKAVVRRLFADVASQIFVGIHDPREAKQLDLATRAMWSSVTVLMKNELLSPAWRRALRGYVTLRDALRSRVSERRNGNGRDLFTRLCQAQAQSPLLEDDSMVRLFIGILLAAFDTTSVATTSMAYALARNPEWQERLRAEAWRVPLGYEHLKQLELHEQVWKETLRLFPTVIGLPRVSLREVQLLGQRIPPGTFVHVLTAPLMRDPRYWSAPERFDPDRFSTERQEDKRHRGAYLPFGAGPHTCLGQPLASLQMKIFWQTLLRRARFRLVRDYAARHTFTPIGCVSGDVELVLEPL
jgi:cytochrome P450